MSARSGRAQGPTEEKVGWTRLSNGAVELAHIQQTKKKKKVS